MMSDYVAKRLDLDPQEVVDALAPDSYRIGKVLSASVVRCFFPGCFFIQRFLQLSLCLMIELLVPSVRLSGLLPQLIGAADNFYTKGPSHSRFSLLFKFCKHNPTSEERLSGKTWFI